MVAIKYEPNFLASFGKGTSKTSYNEEANVEILTYLRSLKTFRINKGAEDIKLDKTNLEYQVFMKDSSTFFSIYCYSDDLSIIGVHSYDDSILPGNYKILNGDFDYKYIDKLISKKNH